jgi:adenine-specific DNA-methyltransferase
MASVRYLGSKSRISEQIINLIRGEYDTFYDLFCGTGAVSEMAASKVSRIVINDILNAATVLSEVRLIATQDVNFLEFGGYSHAIKLLNQVDQVEGFMFHEYSPEGDNEEKVKRKYFTSSNARKIDAVRNTISNWTDEKRITPLEGRLLIGDLLEASNRVANISGTYGCFLKDWTNASLQDMELKSRDLQSIRIEYKVYNEDVFNIKPDPNENAVVYLDPPYTKRQYPAYYHILETITEWDNPKVSGKTGLREWKEKASPFSYKSKALKAIMDLVTNLNHCPVYLSYSSEGHVSYSELKESLNNLGKVTFHDLGKIGRYRPNKKAGDNASDVTEYLVEILPQ